MLECDSPLQIQIIGGPMLHSKKNGDGYVDTSAKMDRIAEAIQKRMDSAAD